MKKILLVAVLVGVVYMIGGTVSDAINNKDNAAQAFANGTTETQVTALKDPKLATKNGKVLLSGEVRIKSQNPTNITFLPPTVWKDGQPYSVASTSFTAYIKRITFARFNRGITTNGPTVLTTKGQHTYAVQWLINESSLTPGIYTMSLTGYTLATTSSTTIATYPLPKTSDTTIIRPTTPAATATTLQGLTYRLTTVRGTTVPASSTVDIAFSKNGVTLKVCNTFNGTYQLSNSRLSFARLTSTKMACGVIDGMDYSALEQLFMKAFRDQPLVFLTGDTMTLSSPNGGVLMFKKIPTLGAPVTPPVGMQIINGVRTYPCDFIGPLEVGAVRNCGTGLGNTGGTITLPTTPTLTALSPSVGSVGTTVTLTGTNFSNTRNVVLMDNLNVAGSGLPAAYITTSNGTSLTFVIPTTHICPPPVDSVQFACNQANLAPGTYNVQVQTPNGTSNNLSMVLVN